MSKARILADLISDSQITASEITGLELNAIQEGDTIVEVSDTGSGGKVVVRVDGADNAEFNAGGMVIPKGTTAQRDPAAVVGSLRYNTTTGFFETLTVSGWGSVATPPSITGVTPSSFSGEAGSTFTVNGAFFDANTTALLKGADGTEYSASTVTFVSSSQITLTNATNLPVANEPFKVKVTNGAGLSVESAQVIDAGSVPTFTTAAGSIATTTRWDEAVSVTVQATDAESTISGYAVTEGNLPAGLTLNGTTGAITGTSTAQTTTTYTFTIEATDSGGNTNTRQFNIQIVNAAPVWSSPAEGGTEQLTLNSAGSITLNATDPEGEAVSYTSGTLPTGLSLSGNVISGTPTVAANTSVAVTASDGFASSVRNFSVNVAAPITFSATTFTGNGSAPRSILTGVDNATNGGLVWLADRGGSTPHILFDSVRNNGYISTDTSSAVNYAGGGINGSGVTSFDSDGFTLGDALSYWNSNGANQVAWNFARNPNTFDIVAYTGNGVNGRQITHSLNYEPGMIFVKKTNASRSWIAYHKELGGTQYFEPDTASVGAASTVWDNTNPTSNHFTIGTNSSVNDSGDSYVAYLWAHNPGTIYHGSFTGQSGNHSITAPGFQPRAVFVKNVDTQYYAEMRIWDYARGMSVGNSNTMRIGSIAAEAGNNPELITLSNGFRVNISSLAIGNNFIYTAIA